MSETGRLFEMRKFNSSSWNLVDWRRGHLVSGRGTKKLGKTCTAALDKLNKYYGMANN